MMATQTLYIACLQLATCGYIPTQHCHRNTRSQDYLRRSGIATHIPFRKRILAGTTHQHNTFYRHEKMRFKTQGGSHICEWPKAEQGELTMSCQGSFYNELWARKRAEGR